ncbi:MAG: hypothetical protein JO339_08030 [Alphaproteobacteria bacterium]|nr:hypothetical protein [Alphaproteobacteria bacterium]
MQYFGKAFGRFSVVLLGVHKGENTMPYGVGVNDLAPSARPFLEFKTLAVAFDAVVIAEAAVDGKEWSGTGKEKLIFVGLQVPLQICLPIQRAYVRMMMTSPLEM